MIERNSNPRKQGDAGMGVAIGWFASNGYTVSIPLTDSQPYDLIVDNNLSLQKVSVKTTTSQQANGKYRCDLRTRGGNKSSTKTVMFSKESADLLFIASGDGKMYLIPTGLVDNINAITLSKEKAEFEVTFAGLAER